MLKRPKPLVLLILDGFWYTQETENNAIAMANTPYWIKLLVYVRGDKPLLSWGSLSDLAPIMLAILGIEQSSEMTGKSLLGLV
ncbi:MAG: hypothetical protein HOP23_08715 [Methylococcaceae bacterium]|nr:hypothetical protein [Methylococcaceae bacterium]